MATWRCLVELLGHSLTWPAHTRDFTIIRCFWKNILIGSNMKFRELCLKRIFDWAVGIGEVILPCLSTLSHSSYKGKE